MRRSQRVAPLAARRRPSPSDELYEAPVNSFVAKFLGKSVCLPARRASGTARTRSWRSRAWPGASASTGTTSARRTTTPSS